MKPAPIILVLFILSSCIPLRIAPTIKDDKVMLAKKFKRNLPREHAFIFEDPKEADEFYNFINAKYDLGYDLVESNVPFSIEGNQYFLSFYETEIPTKTLNLVPIVIDAKLESNGHDPLLADAEFSRKGKWFLVLTVSDTAMNDCLSPNYKLRDTVVKYLRQLKAEYLNTHNYVEVLLKN